MKRGMDVKAKAGAARGTGIAPGPVIIHSSKISQSSVSQTTITKLRTIGADPDTIKFAERQASKAVVSQFEP